MSPPIFLVLGLAVFFGVLSTVLVVIAVATDYWEVIDFSGEQLAQLHIVNMNASYLNDSEGFYQVAVDDKQDETNITIKYYYFRDMYGGIWKICDTISDEFRQSTTFKNALSRGPYLQYHCFNYIHEFSQRRDTLEENGLWIIRMQNSASSCNIVSLMCLFTAAITGTFGVLQKQVTAGMVTGVMYVVSAVFVCFGLVIMHTKVNYMQNQCFTLDPLNLGLDSEFCGQARTVRTGWSVPVAWTAFSFLIIASILWELLARYIRQEKAKSLI